MTSEARCRPHVAPARSTIAFDGGISVTFGLGVFRKYVELLMIIIILVLQAACEAPAIEREKPSGLGGPPSIHGLYDGFSLSDDGDQLAVMVPGAQSNSLLLLNTQSGTTVSLAHPSVAVRLTDPAFSPDGRIVAFVASRWPFDGASEVLKLDIQTLCASTLPFDSGVHYKNLAFSPDGSKLAYFKGVRPMHISAPPLPAESPNFWYALFEYDFKSGVEIRLSSRPLQVPSFLAYESEVAFLYDGDGFGGEAEPFGYDNWFLGRAKQPFAGPARGFRLVRGSDIPEQPKAISPPLESLVFSRLIGFRSDGVLGFIGASRGSSQSSVQVLNGGRVSFPFPAGSFRGTPAAASLARNSDIVAAFEPPELPDRADSAAFIVKMALGKDRVVSFNLSPPTKTNQLKLEPCL